ncbi:CBS domain-containing protein [Gemelliphila palaticanis]|uniref:CBS domain-containing protein n=1 Tax=Gemelliphila palaticanis TaxID=81950 RepID=A0ABX2SZG8_9BACL|nr:CBS domain-containing protein [Gemella palaticanis]MBF0715548.1 CBS domain-containing protein [Gemella palaticanis]NYS47478.1 CBS domain-containing protein [Gemella palaticanis]
MELSNREQQIVKIVQKYEPITGDEIARELSLSKSTIRTELSILVKLGILVAKTNTGYFYNKSLEDNKKYDIFKSTKVENVMGLSITANVNETFSQVISKLFIHDVGTIFIVDDNDNLAGVVSRKDLLKIMVSNSNAHIMPIAMAMTRVPNVVYTLEGENLLDPLRKIINHEVDCIPVVNTENNNTKVIGRISKTTIIRIILDILEG